MLRELFFNIQIFENLDLQIFIVYIIFSLFVLYLILTDNRFKKGRKLLFIILNILFFLISIIINKAPYLIIKDLFWYSLVLNTSFIFHVLILDRIFYWAWKNRRVEDERKKRRYEYIGFIASRISFTLSIWGLIYFLKNIKDKILWFFNIETFILYENNDKGKQIGNKYIRFYKNHLKKNKSIEWFNKYIYMKLELILNIILIILMYFSKNFHVYANLLLGKNKKLNWNELFLSILFFFLFFIISIIMGISRLYIIWAFFGMLELKNILTFKYEPEKERNVYETLKVYKKIRYIMKYDWSELFYLLYRNKFDSLEKIHEDIYDKFFLFDLIKFLGNKYQDGKYSYIWMINSNRNRKFPILKIYRFYPWEVLIKGYIKSINDASEYNDDEIQLDEAKKFINLINGDINIIYMIYPEKDPTYIYYNLNYDKIFFN